MKRIVYLLMVVFISVACSSDGDDGMMETLNSEGNGSEAAKGTFVSDAHPTSGMAIVNEDISNLSLTNFKTDDGPLLLLYLSTEVDSQEYVDLGELKGLDGDYDYDIPAGTDIEKYKYVVVWCVDFSVSFGHAELK